MSDLAKARRLLVRSGAWIDVAQSGYVLRIGTNRRARVLLTFDEGTFHDLVVQPGLRIRPGGGWVPRTLQACNDAAPEPGRPGMIEGLALITDANGRLTPRRANLGQSPVTWLARRTDEAGRPWLTPAQVAAAGRLSLEAEASLRGPSVTMRWDALPRSGGGSATRAEPGGEAMAAGRRVEAALKACGTARQMIEAICVRASSLQFAEQGLGLRRRTGKALLVQGLTALATHYRIG
ncbi:DUF6456 domain-containing protein [Brevundimonas sp.]